MKNIDHKIVNKENDDTKKTGFACKTGHCIFSDLGSSDPVSSVAYILRGFL